MQFNKKFYHLTFICLHCIYFLLNIFLYNYINIVILILKPIQSCRLIIIFICLVNILSIFKERRKYIFHFAKLRRTIAKLFITIVFFYFMAFVFGMTLLEHFTETLHFSLLLTSLTAFPVCIIINEEKWPMGFIEFKIESMEEESIYIPSFCAICGAWIGCFVIPLDWDRPWQLWPISCIIGCLTANMFGHLYCLFKVTFKSSKSLLKWN